MHQAALQSDPIESIRATLRSHGQEHLLTFINQITPPQRAALLHQLQQLDFPSLDNLINTCVLNPPPFRLPSHLEPAPFYPSDPAGTAGFDAQKFTALGLHDLQKGRIAAFTVAGGQGTRLGWNGPKGTFPATVVTAKPLFRVFAEQILATQRRMGSAIPWYIMTSPLNDADTRAFFADNRYFGLRKQDVFMFPQGVIPSFDAQSGKLLLAEKWEIAVNPDGHGGSIKALHQSGALEDMLRRGIQHISYFQVDNPLVRALDPLFIGLHAHAPDSSAQVSSKMVLKAGPDEKVGVFCRADGKTRVIEYSDLPPALAHETDAAGCLRFNAGSIAIHMLSVRFVQQLTADPAHFGLPYHRAEKKVPCIDTASAQRIQPHKPNAVKLETFVFDAIPLAQRSIVLQTLRREEFAPIKNADGDDSPLSCAQAQTNRHGHWLESLGVRIPRRANGDVAAKIEISPLTALEPDHLRGLPLPRAVEPGSEIVL